MIALPFGAPLTSEDLERMPDDGHRYELVDGVLLVTPAPGATHQVCLLALYRHLHAARRSGEVVMVAPFDYVVSRTTVLQPDLLVARRSDLAERRIGVPPLLAVEVLSPSSRRTDPGTKKLAYQDAGVPDYWIVDPAEPGITAFRLEGGSYVEEAHVAGDEVFTTDRPFGMSVVPARLLDDLRP